MSQTAEGHGIEGLICMVITILKIGFKKLQG